MPLLSKDIFLKTQYCPTLGWGLYHEKIREGRTPDVLFRMEQGKTIGKLARDLHPVGVLVRGSDTKSAASRTRELMEDPSINVIFEGTFITGNYVAKADILIRNGNSWDLIEVKSVVNQDQKCIEDMAYTTVIAKNSGFNPVKIYLQHINKEYRLGMPPEQLFKMVNCTEEVLECVEQFELLLDSIDTTLHSPEEPVPTLSMKCKKCDYFDTCLGSDVVDHIFSIPYLRENAFNALFSSGYLSIHDIPDGFPLSSGQEKTVRCVQCGEISIDPVLAEKLDNVVWPAYYLDFETAQLVIPCYPNLAPYDSFPTQYSIHLCDRCGNIIDHREYLADPSRDCRRELAERLIDDLAGTGSIITYSSYERTTITGLSGLFRDLEGPLESLKSRIVDLEHCIKCVKHPQFRGRTSIKVVLPALVPALSYDNLAINDGMNAMVTFASMIMGLYTIEEMQQKREELLEYCKLDTLAMVMLHEKLHEMIEE
jgi:hypothetical protein